jgi:hypothetical protein
MRLLEKASQYPLEVPALEILQTQYQFHFFCNALFIRNLRITKISAGTFDLLKIKEFF